MIGARPYGVPRPVTVAWAAFDSGPPEYRDAGPPAAQLAAGGEPQTGPGGGLRLPGWPGIRLGVTSLLWKCRGAAVESRAESYAF